jgi:hypothetical protein
MSNVGNITTNHELNTYRIPGGVKSVDVDLKPKNPVNQDKKVDTGVSVNEYGDEFLRSSVVKTDDGVVYEKPRNSDDDKARVPREEELPKIDSLIGYTAAQVEEFYYEGRISRYDYDVKMEQKKELLQSDVVNNGSRDAKSIVGTANDAKASDAQEAVTSDSIKQEDVKIDNKKAEESERQAKASSDEIYKTRKHEMDDVISDVRERDKVFNAQMMSLNNEQRSNEEFEIVESGEDPLATFKVVQGLNNLGSGVEGGTWNIA